MEWKNHGLFPFYYSRLEPQAETLKRRVFLLWHPDAKGFFFYDPKMMPTETLLGWQVIAYCDAGAKPVLAMQVDVTQIPGGVQLHATPTTPPE